VPRRRQRGHVCLSRAGLLLGCNHYLTHGAEVDQHIAEALFPDGSGLELLKRSRAAKLVKFTAPFGEATEAANPYGFSHEHELPGLLCKLLWAWAYKIAEPQYSVANERDGSALQFKGCIPPDRLEIIDVEDEFTDSCRSAYAENQGLFAPLPTAFTVSFTDSCPRCWAALPLKNRARYSG
jgi:hypothetical protein